LDPQLGDTPMISRWKLYGLQAMLAAALSAAPAVAGPDTDTPKLTDSQRLEAIQTQLGELKDTLKSLDTLKGEMAKLRAATTILVGLQDRITALSERIAKMERDMDGFRAQMNSGGTRVAGASPLGQQPPPGNSTIRLRNTYPTQVSIVLNGLSYQLTP